MSEIRHFTLPGKYYTDTELHAREMERFFFGSWIAAGRADQIARTGDYFLRTVGGESIIVVRGEDDRVRAFFNVCRHRGTRMCTEAQGKFAGRIQCPYHAWSYAYDGQLAGAPKMNEVEGFRQEDFPLHAVGCEVWDGHIFLNFSKSPSPLVDHVGHLAEKFRNFGMADLRLAKRIVYEVKANWKLVVQNYNECVHCPIIHPLLNKLTHYLGGVNDPPTSNSVGGAMVLRDGIETMTLDGKRRRAVLPGLTGEETRHIYYFSLLPNFLLSLHPDYMMTHVLWPRGVDATEVVCEWHFHPDEMAKADFSPDDAVQFWDLTNREDWKVSELSQLGISSRAYVPGPYSSREDCLWAVDERVRARLE